MNTLEALTTPKSLEPKIDLAPEVFGGLNNAFDNSKGIKFDGGKLRYDLLPPDALKATTEILTLGATKYGDRNWEKGMEWSRVFGAAQRHLWAWFNGEDLDSETGRLHLSHAACCIMFLQAYALRGHGTDDRKKN